MQDNWHVVLTHVVLTVWGLRWQCSWHRLYCCKYVLISVCMYTQLSTYLSIYGTEVSMATPHLLPHLSSPPPLLPALPRKNDARNSDSSATPPLSSFCGEMDCQKNFQIRSLVISHGQFNDEPTCWDSLSISRDSSATSPFSRFYGQREWHKFQKSELYSHSIQPL